MDSTAIFGITYVDIIGWSMYTVVSLALLVWVLWNTFPGQIMRDSLNKEKAAQHARYRQLASKKERLYHHAVWARNDGNAKEAEKLEAELEEAEAESKELAALIGRRVKAL